MPINVAALGRLMSKHVAVLPIQEVLREAVIKLSKRSEEKLGIHSALGYDPEHDRIYINHPDFLFYLRWRLVPLLGGAEPSTDV